MGNLVRAVERESRLFQNAFSLEEAILCEAIQQNVDYAVIEKDTKVRWRQILSAHLHIDTDSEVFLQRHLNMNLVVMEWIDRFLVSIEGIDKL